MDDASWEKTVDFLVIGSGAGGLIAALAAKLSNAEVLVVEKSHQWGGTSATSGGGIWIPNSHIAAASGAQDSPEEAFQYLRALSADNVPDDIIRAFIDRSPEMLRWLGENTPVAYLSIPYTDYHAELPGGKLGFRTHLPMPLDGKILGDDVMTLRAASPAASLFGRINWNFTETTTLLMRPTGWMLTLARMLLRYYGDIPQRLRSAKDRYLTLGNALTGGLRIAYNKAQGQFWLHTKLVELIKQGDAIVGAVVERDGRRMRIAARRGVLLASGGFERDPQMRARHLPGSPETIRSGSQENNTGDAIVAGEAVGAAVANMDSAWWAPVWSIPNESRGRLVTIERALPGCIIVNQAGVRYMNEAASYHVVGRTMLNADKPGARSYPSWFIFDANYRHKYPVGPLLPLLPEALHPRNVRAALKKASTIAALAHQIDVPVDNLRTTISAFNANAALGRDPDFHRGEAAYDRFYGDPRTTPNPCLAPIVKAPFYAMAIYPGDIGSNGGLVTNASAQVLDRQGVPIVGLYAAGNTTASVMGRSYPGAGATLGPSLTFGYIAARHAVEAS